MTFSGSRHLPLLVILLIFVVSGVAYAWATPPLEASDELWHFGMIDSIADTGQLPVQQPGVETQYEQEGSQPPLYYLIGAALVSRIDRSDFDALRQPNPHAKAGIPGATDNKNLVLHTPNRPLERSTLAVYLVRGFSLLLACVTIMAVYQIGSLIGGLSLAALSAGVTAFNPMFLFISASVNNDNLVIALNSLMILLALTQWYSGWRWWQASLIAVLFALSSLSKLSGLALLPALMLLIFIQSWRDRNPRRAIGFMLLMGGVWLALAGWWYARNLTLYGELFGTRTMLAVAGPRLEPFTLNTLLDEFEGFRIAYWGLFGAVNILTISAFYIIMDAFSFISLVSWLSRAGMRRRTSDTSTRNALITSTPLLFLAVIIIVGSAAVIAWTAQTYASQGRLLFPFMAALSPFFAYGLVIFIGVLERRFTSLFSYAPYVLTAALAAFAASVPFISIAPHYAPPSPLPALPDSARTVYARFGEVELVGYETPAGRYAPGDSVPITVYWRVIQPGQRDLSLYLHAVAPAGDEIGKIDSFPGGGRLRTTTWQAGAIYADTYAIPLDQKASGRYGLRVQVGWWHHASGEQVQAVDENGAPLNSVMLDAGGFVGGEVVLPEGTPTPGVVFGDLIELTGYTLTDNVLTLVWRTIAPPPEDYTVFAQVLDTNNNLVGQGDAPPDLPTHFWRAGEYDPTTHNLIDLEALRPGTYQIIIGWYQPVTFARLSAAYPDNAYPLMTFTVAG